MNKSVLFVRIFIIFCTFSSFYIKSVNSSIFNYNQFINRIEVQNKKEIQELFLHFMKNTSFGYTLLGDKPVSSINFSVPEFLSFKIPSNVSNKLTLSTWLKISILNSLPKSIIPLRKKWEIWKNCYQNNILITNDYLLFEENSNNGFSKMVLLINRKSFIEIVDKNESIFKKFLGSSISGKSLLNQVEKTQSLMNVIKNNDFLFGILLGYGSENAKLYYQRAILNQLYKVYESCLNSNANELKNIVKNINKINSKLKHFNDNCYYPFIIYQINFCAKTSSPQTRFLREKYSILKGRILDYVKDDDFLQNLLLKLFD